MDGMVGGQGLKNLGTIVGIWLVDSHEAEAGRPFEFARVKENRRHTQSPFELFQ
jgi:hypothetical protein